ncbi:MAG: hypothetical protein QXU73_06890 [Thermoplasmata archaeon]
MRKGEGMGWNGTTMVVWDEGGICHAIKGRLLDDDDLFLVILLAYGAELRIAKSRIVKIERVPEVLCSDRRTIP